MTLESVSSASSSTLTRYRPYILAVTGGAAAYAVYVLIKAVNSQPQPSLRRSNAVHRHQRPQRNLPSDAQHDSAREENEDTASIAGTDISYRSGLADDDESASGDEQALRQITYHIAEERAMNEGMEHHSVTCDQCSAQPIRGIRWRCTNCPDFDLCSDCEATNMHDRTHIFEKIRVTLRSLSQPRQPQPVMYPGRPEEIPHSVDMMLKRTLASDLDISHEIVDGYWQKFTVVANTPYPNDPNNVGWAINRKAFDSALVPRFSTSDSKPNLVFDRIFSLLDYNGDGLIGFVEFMTYFGKFHKRKNKPVARMELAFRGFDVLGNGSIGRQDVLRVLRAFYRIQRDSVYDYVCVKNQEFSVAGALDTIESSKPLSSVFTVMEADDSTPRRLAGKQPDKFGDMQPASGDEAAVVEKKSTNMSRNEFLSRDFGGVGQGKGNLAADRWRRREFYLDEEEGFIKPPDSIFLENQLQGLRRFMNDGYSPLTPSSPPSEEEPQPPVSPAAPTSPREMQSLSRTSRSSSRVRFDDDVQDMDDNRSTTSTASRPKGERWGGYQLPTPEIDLGQDIMYQLIQEALNTLLDPLFKDAEDLALDADSTLQERTESAPLLFLYENSMNFGHNGQYSGIFLDPDLKLNWETAIRNHFQTWLLPLSKLVDPSHRLFRRAFFVLIPLSVERRLKPEVDPVRNDDETVSATDDTRRALLNTLWTELSPALSDTEPGPDDPPRRHDPLCDSRANALVANLLHACDFEDAPPPPNLSLEAETSRAAALPAARVRLLSWQEGVLEGEPQDVKVSNTRIEALCCVQHEVDEAEVRGGPGKLSLAEFLLRVDKSGGELDCLAEWLDVAFF